VIAIGPGEPGGPGAFVLVGAPDPRRAGVAGSTATR